MKYIAYCTKGLEEIVSDEISMHISDGKIIEVADKRVVFESREDCKSITSLKTADDLGLLCGRFENIDGVEKLVSVLHAIDFISARNYISKYRKLDDTFSITSSLANVAGFSIQTLINAINTEMRGTYNWTFTPRKHTNFDIRIFADHTTTYVSIRLTHESLHHRQYKQFQKPGSLKPSIAAAMILLTTKLSLLHSSFPRNDNKKIIDNFCGSGTILCEAFSVGYEVFGGDINPESVLYTLKNLANLGFQKENHIKHLNAIKTTWPSQFFDLAISNLPWDKQIPIKSITDLYKGTLEEYRRIVKPDRNMCFLLSKPELFVKYAKKFFPEASINVLPIYLLGQNPSLVLIERTHLSFKR